MIGVNPQAAWKSPTIFTPNCSFRSVFEIDTDWLKTFDDRSPVIISELSGWFRALHAAAKFLLCLTFFSQFVEQSCAQILLPSA